MFAPVALALLLVQALNMLGGVAHAADAARLHGVIRAAGQPVAGAQVTARAAASEIAVTVYTDLDGRYELTLPSTGHYLLAARHAQFAAALPSIEVGAPLRRDVALAPDPDYLDAIPSDRWLALLPDGAMKREFILNCASCHEIDAARVMRDGQARSREQWAEAFKMMRAIDQYALLPPDFDDAAYAAWLAQHITQERVMTLTPRLPQDVARLAGVRITEYPLPEADELPHDLVVGPQGRIWITAFFNDLIWALDPASGAYETYELRAGDADGWGQARALAFDAAGTLWVVLGGSHQLVALDPATRAVKTYDIGMYAHSMAIDDRGRIWFNDYFTRAERIGVFDPVSASLRHIALPSAGLTHAQGLPLPYGLQIDGRGRLYSTQLAANTLAMYDTRAGNARLFTLPTDNAGPRRPAIDAADRVWIPEWNTGFLTRFDPQTETFTRYRIGSAGLGGYDAEVDRRTGEVWVTGALAASMVVFDPRDESVLDIPLPTNPGYTRHLAIDPATGDLWSAYSSMPAARPRVVRIERRP